jgi:PilZ domain
MGCEDRRTFERMKLELPLSYSGENCEGKNYVHTHDISAEGLGVTSDNILADGAQLDMSLRVPRTEKEFTVKGKVVWSRKCGGSFRSGISLCRAELMEISTILRFIHSC